MNIGKDIHEYSFRIARVAIISKLISNISRNED